MKIAIVRGSSAFLPEVEAYISALGSEQGVMVSVVDDMASIPIDVDVTILFCGFFPFWKRYYGRLVVEYHSLSTGRFARLKNLLKRLLNLRGHHYIFLNEEVRRGLFFSSRCAHSLRGMGYDPQLAGGFAHAIKKFDFVYCGSIRAGVISSIEILASRGFSIAVVGAAGHEHDRLSMNQTGKVTSFGKLPLDEAYRVMASSRHGLNITPDVYPYNIQDSTKVIEYLGLGLKVVSNRYKWLIQFEAESGARTLDFNNVNSLEDLKAFEFSSGNIEEWAWPRVISRSGLLEAVLKL